MKILTSVPHSRNDVIASVNLIVIKVARRRSHERGLQADKPNNVK